MTERLVVIGGDAAGMTAAARARRRRDPDDLEIVAFERGPYTSYSACGIPYFVGGLLSDIDGLIARSPDEHRKNGIDVRTGHEVVAIDVNPRRVRVRDLAGDGRERDEPFDQLVVATGSVPSRPDVPGVDAAGIFGVQTLADGVTVRQAVDERKPRRAVVVGGGYVGLEMAEALVRRGLEVALVDRTEQPMASTLDLDMGELVADALRAVGVSLHLGETVDGFETANGSVRAVHTANRSLPADVVILGLGVRPNIALASEAGIAVGDKGGIVTDARMETSVGGVWAAGDCVESVDRITGLPVVVALGTHANKQGRVVGINATGGDVRFPGVVGTAVSKICVYEVARTGLTEREAAELHVDVVAAKVESTSRAGYYPGAAPITVKVVAERPGGRLVGAQIVGAEGAAKRIDVLATAIWNRMGVDEVASLDLSYAPPFSPVWDPVLVAARKAADLVG
ncbi:MAG TPA: FAD-dependent oxidoreductase [Acidimicrobiia bacterium]|nr:FAD-dependent oxidoreductase [Acidimicrobiia bacterium]